MSFPSPTTASTVGEPTLRGQLNVHQNLVYWRMEEADPSKRFRNNMQLILVGGYEGHVRASALEELQ